MPKNHNVRRQYNTVKTLCQAGFSQAEEAVAAFNATLEEQSEIARVLLTHKR